jgi:hypothetical protein
MQIEVRKGRLGLVTLSSDPIKHELFRYLFKQVYPEWCGASWQCVPGKPAVQVLQPYDVDLHHMTKQLREQGWCAYYWRDRHSMDKNLRIDYGRRGGIIIGRYCPNLTAWLLMNT